MSSNAVTPLGMSETQKDESPDRLRGDIMRNDRNNQKEQYQKNEDVTVKLKAFAESSQKDNK